MSLDNRSPLEKDWEEKEARLIADIRSERYDETGTERRYRLWLEDNASCVRPRDQRERDLARIRYCRENGLDPFSYSQHVSALLPRPSTAELG